MKILFLTPQLPYPPQKGTAMRNWGLISGLAERHEVAVLSFSPSPSAEGYSGGGDDPLSCTCCVEVVEQPARSLRTRLRDMLTTPEPDMALRLASRVYAERLRDWLAREAFDVVHVEGIELAPYLDVIDEASSPPGGGGQRGGRAPRPLIVFDDHNCEYLLQKRAFLTDLRTPSHWLGAAYSFVQWQRLLDYEAQACRRADRVLAVSEADAAALQKLVPGLQVTVVPNGIDTRAYQPEISNPSTTPLDLLGGRLRTSLQSPNLENTLVFTGTMDFRPNVDAVLWFAQEVLPRIRMQVPDARFLAVGQRPHRRLEVLHDDPAVTLTGFVEDTRPHIADAAVYVVPLRMGGGTRFKILEALAMGKAVVSTRLGAEGFPVAHERELLLADEPDDFAQAVVSLLNAPEKREALGRTGRAFVEQHYDWRVIVPLVEAVCES